ncbi:MAG: DNA mismatch repair endonuclease MutL [Smithellaceae bacterium]|nr:DNA mismatch repair endonuclease MutL [Smithellaceae bacterium]
MPGKIILLPEDLINKIAAGEVIERPASIVKELLENSLDAGATEVSIVLERGGCGGIHLADNGAGLAPDDVPLAFSRHATSKIYQFDDLYQVRSYGFRGEALPSIASIARIEMRTRQGSALAGTKIVLQNGEVQEIGETGCPPGAQLQVSQIFDNVPVRKKFLKSETTEQQLCLEVVSRLVLPHNNLRVRIEAGGRTLLSLPATNNLAERLSLLFDPEMARRMIPIDKTEGGVSLRGYITPPDHSRSNAKQIQFYVNNRFVRDHLLQHAAMTAYRHLLPEKRYPAVFLFLEIPPGEVDVNVHPAKLEVRFRQPQDIYHLIVAALGVALAGMAIAPQDGEPPPFRERKPPRADYENRVREALKRYTVSTGREKPVFYPRPSPAVQESTRAKEPPLLPFFSPEEPALPERIRFSDLDYLGQHQASYLIFSASFGLLIMDQHAAHERILFEELKRKSLAAGNEASGQRLLIPEVISLSPEDFSFFLEIKDTLAELGLEAEPFGADTLVVKSVPVLLKETAPKRLLLDLLDDFPLSQRQKAGEEKKEKIMISLACRASVMARERLTEAEVADLCRILDATPNGYTCPHGRPVYVSFCSRDFQRLFKR